MFEEADAVARLSALAHDVRLRAFRLLIEAGPSGMPAGEIATVLEVPPTAMSFHLAALERPGLVRARRQGRKIFYAVQFDEVRALLSFLTEDCCGGRPELCGSLGMPQRGRKRKARV